MDIGIEANRNSALFATMQEVLDVVNPLVKKARPTVVNEMKHNIPVQPTRWGMTLSDWNGQQTLRFDVPRIGPLLDFNVSIAFRIPGVEVNHTVVTAVTGTRGMATTTVKTGGLNNDPTSTAYSARGRLDRVYADVLLGFNMIKEYSVNSKSKEIFKASGDYLLMRFNQLDAVRQDMILKATTPILQKAQNSRGDLFYQPAVTYKVDIPLWMFFNEHTSHALDVDFSEQVDIQLTLKPPSEIFWYGQLGSVQAITMLNIKWNAEACKVWRNQRIYDGQQSSITKPDGTPFAGDTKAITNAGNVEWDQSNVAGANVFFNGDAHSSPAELFADAAAVLASGKIFPITAAMTSYYGQNDWGPANNAWGHADVQKDVEKWGTAHATVVNIPGATPGAAAPVDSGTGTFQYGLPVDQYDYMCRRALGNAYGVCPPLYVTNTAAGTATAFLASVEPLKNPAHGVIGYLNSNVTFAFPDVDSDGKSVQLMAQGQALYLIQDTDAARALRAQQYPEGTGMTTISYNVATEQFRSLRHSPSPYVDTILSIERGGTFADPVYSAGGITKGNSSGVVEIQFRDNHLVSTTSFMVRPECNFGGDHNTDAGNDGTTIQQGPFSKAKKLGAQWLYTRTLPVHYFEIVAAGRVIYGAPADNHFALSQSSMYAGGHPTDLLKDVGDTIALPTQSDRIFGVVRQGKPGMYIYTVNWGLLASRLQNTGCISLQNLNQPTLRIYLRGAEYNAYCHLAGPGNSFSEAQKAAGMGVRLTVMHEFYNVITINSGNGEITSGLNS